MRPGQCEGEATMAGPAVSARGVQVLRPGPDGAPVALLGDAGPRDRGAGPGTGRPVARGVDLEVARGEVVVVTGRRGAGTTTLLGVLAGRVAPTQGRVSVLGIDPATVAADALDREVAVLPAHAALFEHLTVAETAGMWAGLHPDPRDPAGVLALAGLGAVAGDLVRSLDHAARQRLLLAVTFVGRTALVVCDEPAGGALPGTARTLAAFLRHHRDEGGTAVVAGGRPEVLDPAVVACADRVAVLRRGRLATVGPAGEVIARFASHGAVSVLLADTAEASALTSAVPGATFARVGEATRVEIPDCPPERLRVLTGQLRSVVDLRRHDATLVDAVRRATADRRPPALRPLR